MEESKFGTRRVRTCVAENCWKGSFSILWNACTCRMRVAEDCCESSSVILRNLCCVLRETVGGIVSCLRAVELAEETVGRVVRRTWLHFGRNFCSTWLHLS